MARQGSRLFSGEDLGPRAFLVLLAGFAAVSLFVYREALGGPFVSDDVVYITANPYVQELSLANLAAILDPFGPTIPLTANYSPVHLLLHAVEVRCFGRHVQGYHVVNVLLHALGSALLVLLYRRSRLPAALALGGGAFFLLHPANVEAVAWVSQLKTTSAFVLVLGALLLHPRRPALAVLLFALAILAKPLAAFALPVAGLFDWTREGRVRWGWLGAWTVAFAALALVEAAAFGAYGGDSRPLHPDPAVWARTSVALVARYLAMAATSYGVSSFHELPRATSWLDPWWLAGLGALALLGWRSLRALLRRREEAAWWAWAAISFLPISQIFPFDYAMADRYLYLILPGLAGGTLLAATDRAERRAAARSARPRAHPSSRALRVAVVATLAALLGLGIHAERRARLWSSAGLLIADSATRYPDGRQAHLLAARRAASGGDHERAAAALRAAIEAGYDSLPALLNDPLLSAARTHPGVDAALRALAGTLIRRAGDRSELNQTQLNVLAIAHETLGEIPEAVRAIERALAQGGPDAPLYRTRLSQLRARLPAGARAGGARGSPPAPE